jgi:NADPH:quinone reductase-like Zn-dependent oxidoreductase
MKAARIHTYGGASVIAIEEIDKPTAEEGQVIVEVHAASLNPWDSKLRDGALGDSLKLPVTVGGDIAGTVAEVGPHVTELAVGDKVYGDAGPAPGSGAFAQFALAPVGQVAKLPQNLDFPDAASLPLVGSSAVQALLEHIKLQSGQKLLIHGGTGGIGSIALQVAKHLGAYVATTVPTHAISLAKELGADEVIDFKTQDFTHLIRDYDAVFDTAGGEVFEKSLNVLRPGGIAVSMVGHVDEAVAKQKGVTALTQATKITTERLNKLTELVEQGVAKPHVAKTFPLDQTREAFEARESGQVPGKIVLKIK